METAAAAAEQQQQKKATVVKDFFAQCEHCKYWLRLRPLDEDGGKTGYRTIPLMNWIGNDNVKRERWVCEQCFDKLPGVWRYRER
jgi:hypothetical protein